MPEIYVVNVLTRKLRSEPVNSPTTGIAVLPRGCVLRKLAMSPDPAWWEMATEIRNGEELRGFIEHAALEPVNETPEFFPRAILPPADRRSEPAPSGTLVLGRNERYRDAIEIAAERTGMDPPSLAALIDAEAAKVRGLWSPNSANPRSSAVGLTQFLEGTWIDMAKRKGSLLNELASSRGYLDRLNRVIPAKKAELLACRRDPTLSIVTAAEYGKKNLELLAEKGLVPDSADGTKIARLAYLAHHEGPSGAVHYLNGTLSEARAEKLVRQNVSSSKINALRRRHGTWKATYKTFLDAYIENKIRPERFLA